MVKRLFLGLIVLTNIQACDNISEINTPPIKVAVIVEDPVYLENTKTVLSNRFYENKVNFFSSVELNTKGKNIEIVFNGGAPSINRIKELATTEGKFRVISEKGLVLASEENVTNASSRTENNQYYIMIRLDDQGSTKMNEWTSKNIGQILKVEFDGKTLSSARVMDSFGKTFQFSTVSSASETRDIAMYIRSGALKTNVKMVDSGI